jgi:hypothetical protein
MCNCPTNVYFLLACPSKLVLIHTFCIVQKEQYLAENPQHRQFAKDLALSDDEYIMGPKRAPLEL